MRAQIDDYEKKNQQLKESLEEATKEAARASAVDKDTMQNINRIAQLEGVVSFKENVIKDLTTELKSTQNAKILVE
jgi:chromosome segregation ATPase